MESKIILIFSAIIAFLLVINVQCTSEKIEYFLRNYEITNITYIKRQQMLRTPFVEDNAKRFQISAFGNTFDIDASIYYQPEDIEIDYISKLMNTSETFLDLNYVLHFGFVHGVKKSFVLGFFTEKTPFKGYIVTDQVYCVEPYNEPNMVIVYRFKDVITPGCSKNFDNEDLDCSASLYFKPWKANKPPKKESSHYSLFYDEYLESYKQQLQAKKANETHRKEYHDQDNHHEDDKKIGKQNKTNTGKKGSNQFKGINMNTDNDELEDLNFVSQTKLSGKDKAQHSDAKGKDKAQHSDAKGKDKVQHSDAKGKDKVQHSDAKGKDKAQHSDAKGKDKAKSKEDQQKTKGKERKKEEVNDDNDYDEDGIFEKDDDRFSLEWHIINLMKAKDLSKTSNNGKGKDGAKSKEDQQKTKGKERKKGAADEDDDDVEDNNFKRDDDRFSLQRNIINMMKAEDLSKTSNNGKGKDRAKSKEDQQKTKGKEKKKEDADDDIDDDEDRFSLQRNINNLMEAEDLSKTSNNGKAKHDESKAKGILKNFDNFIASLDMWKDDSYKGNGKLDYEKTVFDGESIKAPITEALSSPVEALKCHLQIVVSPNFRQMFGNSDEMVIKDIIIQISLLNKIFWKLSFKQKDVPFKLTFSVYQIVLNADQSHSPFKTDADLNYFTRLHPQSNQYCLTIGLVNQFLKSGQFFDGYIPEGGGGACAASGRTLIVSHGNADSPAPMALYFAALVRSITRALDANDKDKECQTGSYPNPMQVLQDYVLNDKIETPKAYSIFSTCNVQKIQEFIKKRACFIEVSQPLCGNAVLDEGEVCDCGPHAGCIRVDSCCNPPAGEIHVKSAKNTAKKQKATISGCILKKGAKCSEHQECCAFCEINKMKHRCSSGVGDCDIGMCDGKSADCPVGVEASNGMICSQNDEHKPEPLLCTNNKCEQPLCTSFDLKPCTCALGTGRDCVYCCLKDGKCQAAGKELKLIENRNFFLPNGVECMGGTCLDGKCEVSKQYRYNLTLEKPPRFPVKSGVCQKYYALTTIVGTVLSLLVLFLW